MYVACRSREVLALSGGLRYRNCPNARLAVGVQPSRPLLFLDAF